MTLLTKIHPSTSPAAHPPGPSPFARAQPAPWHTAPRKARKACDRTAKPRKYAEAGIRHHWCIEEAGPGPVGLVDREFAVAAHGNRLVLQLVFNQLRLDTVDDANYDWGKETKRVHKVTGIALEHLTGAIENTYSNNHLAPLFKNTTKCRDLVTQVEAKFGSG
ncbi:hypothetical protein [Streptomyces vinaceus]|uniref:hypothetical protein n=1 Tax=Streptomyces vinaceus TaxID=1960 RepID=UPI0036C38B71